MTVLPPTAPPVFPQTDIERLARSGAETPEAEKARLRAATREFEAFFMYYMLKTMRQTVPKDPMAGDFGKSGSLGKDMFVDMFDMEVARKLTSSNGRSIAQMLYESLEKLIDSRKNPGESEVGPIPLKQPGTDPAELDRDGIEVPETNNGFINHERPARFAPVAQAPRAVRDDPILTRFGRHIYEAAEETGLDSALIASVIRAESNGDPSAVSSAGAKGLMQLTDSTAAEVGVSDQFDPRANIQGGSRYLRKMLDRFGHLDLALAAYNAGPANVDRYGGVPPFKETLDYVTRVTSRLKAHSALDTGKS